MRRLLPLLGFLLPACLVRTEAPHPAAAQPVVEPTFVAGAEVVDITPAPGLGLHGHGPSGRVAQGTLLRLRCHPLVMAQGTEVLALVPCDLAWPSFMLQRMIAEEVQRLLGPRIGAEDIVLLATHTHGAPSHQFASSNYSGILSGPDPGYSKDVTRFLAGHIARGIATAWLERQPARIGWGFTDVYDVGQNRSLDAFGNNQLTPGEALRYHTPGERPLARRVVDPRLSVLRVDDLEGRPIGGFAVFGVHGTSVPNTNELYHGDVFGYATRAFDAVCREKGGPRCRLGVANGLSGDVGPAADYPGPREARRLGRVLGRELANVYFGIETEVPGAQSLRVAYQEVPMRGAPTVRDEALASQLHAASPWPRPRVGVDPRNVCDEGALGMVASGGVEESYTLFHPIGDVFREGSAMAIDHDGDSCHAPKRSLAVVCQGDSVFPTVAPIHVAAVGDVLLTTFPAEVTVTAGRRASERLERWLGARPGGSPWRRVVPITHAGEYFQYVTTEDEYQRQSYEGASTLYGPNTLRLFANEHACLARSLLGDGECRDVPLPTRPNELGHLTWKTTVRDASAGFTRIEGPVAVVGPRRATRDGEEGLAIELRQEEGCPRVQHFVRARAVDADSGVVVDDDDGDGMAVRFVAEDMPGGCSEAARGRGGCPYWEVSWFPEAGTFALLSGRRIRFEIRLEPTSTQWPVKSAPIEIPATP